jgi:hypothetical protein
MTCVAHRERCLYSSKKNLTFPSLKRCCSCPIASFITYCIYDRILFTILEHTISLKHLMGVCVVISISSIYIIFNCFIYLLYSTIMFYGSYIFLKLRCNVVFFYDCHKNIFYFCFTLLYNVSIMTISSI